MEKPEEGIPCHFLQIMLICVENLYPHVDVGQLVTVFKVFGRILSANIEVDKQLVSSGKGYIRFDNVKSAQNAVQEMNGKKVLGNPLLLRLDLDKSTGIKKNLQKYTKVFVKNINTDWDDADLHYKFSRFGEVTSAAVAEANGISNGYGFVQFHDHTAAKKAVETFHNQILDGKKITVQPFIPKDLRENEPPKTLEMAKEMLEMSIQLNNLHVKNLPPDMTEDRLRDLFRKFGEIGSIKVERDRNLKCKGYGFVCFKNAKDAEKARDKMDRISYCSKVLEVNFNQKKEARKQYLHMINNNDEVRRFKSDKETTESVNKDALFSFSAKNK